MSRKRLIIIGLSIAAPICSHLGFYLHDRLVEEPRQDAAQLTEVVESQLTTLRAHQNYMAGYALAMQKQLEDGDLSPGVLKVAADLAVDAEAASKEAESIRQEAISVAARRHLTVDRNRLAFLEIVELNQGTAIGRLKNQIASIESGNRVKTVVRKLEREEAAWAQIEVVVANEGMRLSGRTRDAILDKQQVVTAVVGEAEQTAKAINASQEARCPEHGDDCRRTAQELLQRAHRLQELMEKIRGGVLEARNDHDAA